MIGGMGRTAAGQKTLPQIAVAAVGLEDGKLADGMLRSELATWDLDAAAFALTAERVLDEAKAGQGVGAASAMLKYYGTELNKRRQEMMVALHGSDAMVWEGEASREGAIRVPGCAPRATRSKAVPPRYSSTSSPATFSAFSKETLSWQLWYLTKNNRCSRTRPSASWAKARRSVSCVRCATIATKPVSPVNCGRAWSRWALSAR
ncbi:acyl-CoA dehydrogenase family protein [Halopseudomonas pachastrellae]|nr:acyl-CoA dehydrogenase family protein [Halopseudomonas pachastrellae]